MDLIVSIMFYLACICLLSLGIYKLVLYLKDKKKDKKGVE